jgi:hypothetical protein
MIEVSVTTGRLYPSTFVMEPIRIAEHLDPSSRVGDTESEDRSGKKGSSRRKQAKAQTPVTPEDSIDTHDESHQLDELA